MVEKKAYKVAAYMTAYQEIEAVDRCIGAIERQSYPIKEIFIVDNSSNDLELQHKYTNVTVDRHPENVGVAGGLNIAIRWAIEKGYDFLWLFDQDSEPGVDVLEKLLLKYQELSSRGEKLGIITPQIIDINTQQEFPGYVFSEYQLVPKPGYYELKDFYDCDAVITSGSLVNISAAKCVELPKSEYFLDAVDYSYCMNFRKEGYKIIVVKDAMMKHRIGKYSKVKVRKRKGDGEEVTTFICSPSRYYYACRNHTYFETRAAGRKMLYPALKHRLKFSKMMIERIISYEPDLVVPKIWACVIGTFDGLRGKLGKTW